MGRKDERYCFRYRLTNTKTGETFEGRKWSNVVKQAGLKTSYNTSTLRKTKKWKVEVLEEPLPWNETTYRKELYIQTKARYPKYEKKKAQRDPLYEKRKRLKIKKWKNLDGTPFTAEQHTEMMSRSCEVCSSTKHLAADHCHKTGIVRGTLCRRCNVGLGHLQDSVEVLGKMMEYLKEHEEKVKCLAKMK